MKPNNSGWGVVKYVSFIRNATVLGFAMLNPTYMLRAVNLLLTPTTNIVQHPSNEKDTTLRARAKINSHSEG